MGQKLAQTYVLYELGDNSMLGVRNNSSNCLSKDLPKGGHSSEMWHKGILIIGTLIMIAGLISVSVAELEIDDEHKDKWDCPTCNGQDESQLAIFNFLGHNLTDGVDDSDKPSTAKLARAAMEAEEGRDFEDFVHPEYLISPDEVVDSDVILDVGQGYSTSHVKGAVPLYWETLLDEDNTPKSASEMSEVLGDAGVSPDDSVVIYGDCVECGGKSVATFVFWAMRYLGHDDVKVLDGGIDAWKEAEKPVESNSNSRPATVYTPRIKSSLLSDYASITSGQVQLVDARTLQEFASDKIPGAIHVDYEEILKNDQIKNGEDLGSIFEKLDEDLPVAIYSNAGAKASMIWYALQLMGYESSIYTWNDWLSHQSQSVKTVVLTAASAEPNPARPGPITIYASFDVVEADADASETSIFGEPSVEDSSIEENLVEGSSAEESLTEEIVVEEPSSEETVIENILAEDNATEDNSSDDEIAKVPNEGDSEDDTVLTVMGCVACFPAQIYAGGSTSTPLGGGVQLGSIGNTPIAEAGALVQNDMGEEMARIVLTHTGGSEYAGIWDASDKPEGVYSVILAATAGGDPFYFEDSLTIVIDNSAPVPETTASSKYVKLGR